MALMARLISDGEVAVEDVVEALETLGLGPVRVEHARPARPCRHEILHAWLEFRQPGNRRERRELSLLHAAPYRDEEAYAHVRAHACTSFAMASAGGGSGIVRDLASRFGGYVSDDLRPDLDGLVEPDGHPAAPSP